MSEVEVAIYYNYNLEECRIERTIGNTLYNNSSVFYAGYIV